MITAKFRFTICAVLLSLVAWNALAVDSAMLRKQWTAQWIDVPESNNQAYGVYLFRKVLELNETPTTFPILVSADNRYKLYVNGNLVSLGPARCDIEHWVFEEVDLAKWLRPGKNVIGAQVWNEGPSRAEAQFSLRTAFILQGATQESEVLNSGKDWKCVQDMSCSEYTEVKVFGYLVVSPNEKVDMQYRQVDWLAENFDDSGWKDAHAIEKGTPKLTVGIDCGKVWRLTPSVLPQMELTPQRFHSVRIAENVVIPKVFPAQKASITIPANTKARILLDNRVNTNAYPTFIMNKGKDAKVAITYLEALMGERFSKGNRDEVEGKTVNGRTDLIITDGSDNQSFTSLFWRTFRYINIVVETKDEPLVIEDIRSTFTGFPFELKAKLDTRDETMQKIFENGWRTARMCAVETYMDCPYYEQLQYGGDTRIQALISLYNTGDARLMKSMLTNLDNSRQPEGITQSRYPSVNPQIIPTYSMAYIWMLHDYMMYVDDPEFVKDKMAGTRQIVDYFMRFTDDAGSIRNLPNWAFVDWANGFMRGMSPVGTDGGSAVLDLHLLLTYQWTAELEKVFGMSDYVKLYDKKAAQLKETIQSRYWDEAKGLFADTVDKNVYSQHANALAILTGMVEGDVARKLALEIQNNTTLTQATLYFKYYTHRAMVKAGLGNNYISWLDVWRQNLNLGLTTWAETSNVEGARSDCHAWGASPNIEFFRTIMGIDSAAPGFKDVVIRPALGDLKQIGGTMPHPNGEITVEYNRGKKLKAVITLPEDTYGTFIWNNTETNLVPGNNILTL